MTAGQTPGKAAGARRLIDCIHDQEARLLRAQVAFGHGTTHAFDEAVWLALWALKLPLDDLDGVAGRLLTPDEQQRIEDLVGERIATRKPAAYLTQEAWLQGVAFYVDERSIVPRSLIAEVMADGLIEPWLPDEPQQILDLCCGNGSLAVLAALRWPQAKVDALDLSADALEVAVTNIERHGLERRIDARESDLFEVCEHRYDLIVCNPPYVRLDVMANLPLEYQHEPMIALAGGKDGMDLVRRIVREAPVWLKPQAALVLEIGNEFEGFAAAFPELEAVWLETSAGDDQVCLLTREALVAWTRDPAGSSRR
jgi:ribosomal protein L3 glutamine methyltransferase